MLSFKISELRKLLESFTLNCFYYLYVFVFMLAVYKLCLINEDSLKSGKHFIRKFLKLYAFGTNESDEKKKNNESSLNEYVKINTDDNVELTVIENETMEGSRNQSKRIEILKFLVCFTGLQTSFLLWGIMQERIVTYGYSRTIGNQELLLNKTKLESEKESFSKFENSEFLVFTNRFAGLVLSSIILIICNRSELKIKSASSFMKIVSMKNWPPLFICSYSSLSNVLSSWFQYESLKYVSFTSQLLAKSSKSVFVMITGMLISKKRYKPDEYFSVGLITVGIFLFSDINHHNSKFQMSTTLPGFICLFGYLFTDSFTSTWQDDLIKKYSISSMSLMFISNVYSCLYTFISILNQNELEETLDFMKRHSDITYHVILLSLTSAIGQIFIFITIQNFGALIFSLIMTTRQVISIVLSAIIFQHYLSLQSCFGIFLIFFALFSQQYFKFKSNTKN